MWKGTAVQTTGGLRKKDLVKNKAGKIVSRKKSEDMKQNSNLGSYIVGHKPKKSKKSKWVEVMKSNIVRGKRKRKRVNYAES